MLPGAPSQPFPRSACATGTRPQGSLGIPGSGRGLGIQLTLLVRLARIVTYFFAAGVATSRPEGTIQRGEAPPPL